ncbi:hypothetical protein C9374_006357 [Naegleria lovaniensis]|uniref:isoleucine--tRNA ligase n=1 Tax=Naegleria lovaniensis TaxID=51637 RepID=A0AA88GMP0_NAELO|nr:uncharacterized protein C9374_006357 [Naegleria lovaniensis]KAG2381368.1 hypothetical protein C9374_006357 [Naegleria lovaniensis]
MKQSSVFRNSRCFYAQALSYHHHKNSVVLLLNFGTPSIISSRDFSTTLSPNVEERDKRFSHTILLPKTPFKTKISVEEEINLQKTCTEYAYRTQKEQRLNQPNIKTFTLHDGPPYANGNLHAGHALNKILKDVTNRYKIQTGHLVQFIPGWDCHGLPIEIKVLQEIKKKKKMEVSGNSDPSIRKLAKDFAEQAIHSQMKDFKRWGIMGDWDNPYKTMNPMFEAQQLRIFLDMLKKKYIFRGKKPVFWSPSSGTALAESELEYPDVHISKSCYILFPIVHSGVETSLNEKYGELFAVDNSRRLIIASDLLKTVCEKASIKNYLVLEAKKGKDLFMNNHHGDDDKTKLSSYQNPLTLKLTDNKRLLPFLNGSHVTTEVGTGLVHTAPNHGMEDFHVVKENNIPIGPCFVDEQGRYNSQTPLEELRGLPVLDQGNIKVIQIFEEELSKYLLFREDYSHRYPYDWRTKKPIIIRMTEQWFAELKNLKCLAKEFVDEKIEMIPSTGRNRLKAFIESRDEWCISRQRTWGVPIPVFYKKDNPSEYLATSESIEYVIDLIEKHGTDYWFEQNEDELLAPPYRNQGWQKGLDTLDVWFDSGTTWFGVMKAAGIPLPVDVYLEGSDQHRGWFQSSLLTSLAYQGIPPYKKIVTHGFITDENGKKMSKSLGNVIEPESIVSKYGIDVLRLWVCFSDFTVDVTIGKSVFEKLSTNLKKIRNTAKFMLGVLEDYVPPPQENGQQCYSNLIEADLYIIARVKQFCEQVTECYENFSYYKVTQHIMTFTYELSSFYLDLVKDRLYCSSEEVRRPCQRVIQYILDCYTKAISPILCHTAEDIYQCMTYKKHNSLCEEGWFVSPEQFFSDISLPNSEHLLEKWNLIIELRQEIYKVIEKARMDKVFRTSNEVMVNIERVDCEKLKEAIAPLLTPCAVNDPIATQLDEIMMVSQVNWLNGSTSDSTLYSHSYNTSIDGTQVVLSISKANYHKCPRCWRHTSPVENEPCQRCHNVLSTIPQA